MNHLKGPHWVACQLRLRSPSCGKIDKIEKMAVLCLCDAYRGKMRDDPEVGFGTVTH